MYLKEMTRSSSIDKIKDSLISDVISFRHFPRVNIYIFPIPLGSTLIY